MEKTILTIVTVCYNDRVNLERTLLSVGLSLSLVENSCDVEHIIIDGGSDDDTLDLIQSYQSTSFYSVKFVSERDRGIYDAMNKGIAKANGAFIQFLNAGDTLIHENFPVVLADLVIFNRQFDLVCYPFVFISSRSVKSHRFVRENVSLGFLCMPTSHQAMFYRKTLMEEYPYDISYTISSDFNHFCRLLRGGIKIAYGKVPVINFFDGGVSSRQKFLLYKQSALSIIQYNSSWLIPVRLLILALRVFL